jgi:DEAD/DEAH box helicase domain-containing protein
MPASAFIQQLIARPEYRDQVAHLERIPARPARFAPLEEPLSPVLQDCLDTNKLSSLYTHQAGAVNAARRGENVMVATASASGKTLCYNVAIIQALLEDRQARAIYLFPTKALAQDQLRTLKEVFSPAALKAGELATFDGDTPQPERTEIKRRARLVLTNPDMLHLGILPNHSSWARFMRHLRYVVVDEAHIYRGVFGSHVANLLARLRRLCRYYGSTPQFILCSATIANPGEHAGQLLGLPCRVIDDDGSPQGGRDFVFWNPPLLDEVKNTRRSANREATDLFTEMVGQRMRSLVFARSRRLTEIIFSYARQNLAERLPALAGRIAAYRAGYLPEQRRQIEQALFSGELLGVVATTALELGIDIGDLEATVLTGYPGSIASTWQQAGRSGRSRERAISFLIGLNNPLDQYFMRHPEYFFERSVENALVNPGNSYIRRAHLLCAAWEQPLSKGDEHFFGPDMPEEIAGLVDEGILRPRHHRWYLTPAVEYPAQGVNIRSASAENYTLVDTDTGSLLETVGDDIAFFQLHPGAVYLHQGDAYLITSLDLPARTALARAVEVDYYTQTRDLTEVSIRRVIAKRQVGRAEVCLGEVEVTTDIVGFKRIQHYTDEVVGEEALELPPIRFPTVAVWFDMPHRVNKRLEADSLDFTGGLHAVEHAAIGILPLFALCDRNDIGGVSTPLHPDTGKAQVFIYDAYPGGIGIAEKGFEMINGLWQATLRAVAECPCQEGCPSCIQSPKCGNNNEPLDKKAAVVMLEELTGK